MISPAFCHNCTNVLGCKLKPTGFSYADRGELVEGRMTRGKETVEEITWFPDLVRYWIGFRTMHHEILWED